MRLLGLMIAAALVSVTLVSAAAAATFSGSSTLLNPLLLSVAFTEVGVGNHPVGYRLEATAEWESSGCDGIPTIQSAVVSSQTESPIVPERGRASGVLLASAFGAGAPGTPGCPPPVRNEDGTYRKRLPRQPRFSGGSTSL